MYRIFINVVSFFDGGSVRQCMGAGIAERNNAVKKYSYRDLCLGIRVS